MFCTLDAWVRKVQEEELVAIDIIEKEKRILGLQEAKRMANKNWPGWIAQLKNLDTIYTQKRKKTLSAYYEYFRWLHIIWYYMKIKSNSHHIALDNSVN